MSNLRIIAISLLLAPLARAGCVKRPSSVVYTPSSTILSSTSSSLSVTDTLTDSISTSTTTTTQSASLTVVSSCPTPTLSDSSPLPCLVDLSETSCGNLNDANAPDDLSFFVSDASSCQRFLSQAGFGPSTDACFPSSYSYSTDSVAIYNCVVAAPILCVYATAACTTATYTAGSEPAPAAPTYANQLDNPTFSTGDLTGWTAVNLGIASQVTAEYSHGGSPAYSLELTLNQGVSVVGRITQAQNVYPGGTYEISYWYRHTAAGLSCTTYATVHNDYGQASIRVDLSTKEVDTWFFANRQIRMSASFGDFEIGAYCLTGVDAAESIYIDDISLVRVS